MAKPLSLPTEQKRATGVMPAVGLRWSGRDAAALDPEPDSRNLAPAAEEDMNQLVSNGSHPGLAPETVSEAGPDDLQELGMLRHENAQLRSLCLELEQALQEASQTPQQQDEDERLREYDALLEEKSETIRQLHQELQNAHSIVAEMEAQVNEVVQQRPPTGPAPREEELLALSEELENERRQLQEDEQTLMQQMREMEVSMARERAEMARQRNDLNRLQSDIRHELERLEKSGAAVRKMEELKRQFADATNRRGLAASSSVNHAAAQPQAPQQAPRPPPRKIAASWAGCSGAANSFRRQRFRLVTSPLAA